MEIRTVAAGRGWDWIVEGFKIFRKQPLTWIVLLIVAMLISFGSVIPIIGIFVTLLMPALWAGLMLACDTTDKDDEPEFSQLFAALKTHTTPLITVGGVFLIGNIIMGSVTIAVTGSEAMLVIIGQSNADIETMRFAIFSLFKGIAVGLAVFLPFLMATGFAPMLVVFRNTPPIEAMKASFTACLRNTVSMLVCGIAIIVLWIIATIPLMLGLIVLLPVLVCSIYASYKDIFPAIPAAPVQDVTTPA
jgi:uncharacterized membrane protein